VRTEGLNRAGGEPVRLVIWDLDDTFWRGTLAEGGCSFVRKHAKIVMRLAGRGIVSSICSKNDFAPAKEILVRNGIWDYFVLPSISWEAKGPRVRALIETMGLRPASAMFIDDNASNREEVRRCVEGVQVRSHEFIPQILKDPGFIGKNDRSMSRLEQYKVLERRKLDEATAGADVAQFLRDSKICVSLDFDVEAHIDRFVELINRTNQLNFTKIRLPEDVEEARAHAREMLQSYYRQAALVHVSDRYGDHGYCGAYVHNSEARKLEHFAFSCRILGMGVERWLYQKLARPKIAIRGEVLADLLDPSPVDWIRLADGTQPNAAGAAPPLLLEDKVTARGGCDLGAVIHYFRASHADAVGEYHFVRDGGNFRTDHSVFLTHALHGISEEAMTAAGKLGYLDSDFSTSVYQKSDGILLLSFPADCTYALYRHRRTGLELPFTFVFPGRMTGDLRSLPESELPKDRPWVIKAFETLCREFDFVGLIDEAHFKKNLREILLDIAGTVRVFIVDYLETTLIRDGMQLPASLQAIRLNKWLRDVCADHPSVKILHPADVIKSPDEVIDHFHFKRQTYFKMYRHIVDHCVPRRERAAGFLEADGVAASQKSSSRPWSAFLRRFLPSSLPLSR
jgi:FkbH-like protein